MFQTREVLELSVSAQETKQTPSSPCLAELAELAAGVKGDLPGGFVLVYSDSDIINHERVNYSGPQREIR